MKQWLIKFAFDTYTSLSRMCGVALVMAAASNLLNLTLTLLNCAVLYLLTSLLLLREKDLYRFQYDLLIQLILVLLLYGYSKLL